MNCFQILYIRSLNTIRASLSALVLPLWIAFRFCIFVLWTQYTYHREQQRVGCELLSDFVYSFFEHNRSQDIKLHEGLWIAFRFCIFVLWTQSLREASTLWARCELLSDFVYSFFEHNSSSTELCEIMLWIAFRFCIFVLWTQFYRPRIQDQVQNLVLSNP